MSKLDTNLRRLNTSTSTTINATDLTDAYFGINQNDNYSGSSFVKDLQWDNPQDIIGYPNMFNQYADPRIAGGKYGRIEFNTILKDTPLVFIQPGTPRFLDSSIWKKMTNGTDEEDALLSILKDPSKVDSIPTEVRNEITKGNFLYDSRYYGFKPSYSKYMKFVNSLATYVATRMGLILSGNDSQRENLRFLSINEGGNYFTSTMVPIFCDANTTTFSEGAQNTTGESMAAGLTKSTSQLAREVEFLFDGQMPLDMLESNFDTYKENITSIAGAGMNIHGILGKISSGITSVLRGGVMMFPEIWQDSQYRKSYDLGVKLWSPYGDNVSIYNNIIFPLICLLCLSLPRQTGRTSYAAPFLVKAYSKGWFSCDLGIVESISITKGENKSWNKDSLPLEVDVKITIKDMYPTMMLTASRYGGLYGYNTGLLEFLDSLAGVGVGEVDYLLGLKTLANTGQEIYNNIESYLTSLYEGQLGKFVNNFTGVLEQVGQSVTPDVVKDLLNSIMGDITNGMFNYDENDAETSIDSNGVGNFSTVTPSTNGEGNDNESGDNNNNNNNNGSNTNPPVQLPDDSIVRSNIKNKKNRDNIINKQYKRKR